MTVDCFADIISPKIKIENVKIIFDIGALYGKESLSLAKRFPNAKIYTFECNPSSLITCYANTSFNNRINFVPLAALDHNGFENFYQTDAFLGGASSFLKFNPNAEVFSGSYQHKVKVPCVKLEDFCELFNINNIDILWLDVQGSEILALAGLGDMMQDIKAICIEILLKDIYLNAFNHNRLDMFIREEGFDRIYVNETDENSTDTDVIYINKKLK